jgi:hypothetical protein
MDYKPHFPKRVVLSLSLSLSLSELFTLFLAFCVSTFSQQQLQLD